MADNSKERRRFPRIDLHTPIHYQVRGIAEANHTLSENISLGGIGFINDKFIAPETTLMLEVNLLSRILRPIGRVVWSAPLPHSNRYRLGVEFLEFNPQERDYLADYIHIQFNKL